MNLCKECNSEISERRIDAQYCNEICAQKFRMRKYRHNNPEKIKEQRIRYDNNTPNRILTRTRSRANIYGIPFNLDANDIEVPTHCPVLGIELRLNNRGQKNHPTSPSLDRIVPSLGYVKGNVRVISSRANLLKSNAEVWELEAVLNDLRKLRGE